MSRANYLFIRIIENIFETMSAKEKESISVHTFTDITHIQSFAGGLLQTSGGVCVDLIRYQKHNYITLKYRKDIFLSLPFTTDEEKTEAIAYLRDNNCLPTEEHFKQAKKLIYIKNTKPFTLPEHEEERFRYILAFDQAFQGMKERKEVFVIVDVFNNLTSITSPPDENGHDIPTQHVRVDLIRKKNGNKIRLLYTEKTFIFLSFTTKDEKYTTVQYLKDNLILPNVEKIRAAKSLYYSTGMRNLIGGEFEDAITESAKRFVTTSEMANHKPNYTCKRN